MTTCTWSAARGSFFNADAWSGHTGPEPGDTAVITWGDVIVSHGRLSGEAIILSGGVTNAPTLDLRGAVIAADTSVMTYQGGNNGCIDVGGRTVNAGTIEARDDRLFNDNGGGTLTVRIGDHRHGGDVLVNRGTLAADYHGTLIVQAAARGDVVVNDGIIQSLGHTVLDADVRGAGEIDLGETVNLQSRGRAFGLLEVNGAMARGQSIVFAPGAELKLGDVAGFRGLIRNFAYDPASAQVGFAESIELTGADITGVRYAGTAEHGVLTLLAGGHAAGHLRFAGAYSNTSFVLTQQGTDSIITLKPG